MSNLPNSQTDNDINNSNDVISIKPGSIFGAAGAESSFVSESPAPPETPKSPEAFTPVPAPIPPKFEEKVEATVPIEETEPVQNVVDKTDQITTLHDIQKTEDKLTEEADEEEEHFIEEVEKHHGDL